VEGRRRFIILLLLAAGCLLVAVYTSRWVRPAPGEAGRQSTPVAVLTLVERPVGTPVVAVAMPGATLTPTAYILAAEPSPEATPTITPTPAPTVDYGREGATGRVQIPVLGIDQVIVPVPWRIQYVNGQPVAQWDTIDGAAAHNLGSAPLGGPGNTVLTGHTRGNGQGEFQNLWDLEAGQEVVIWDSIGRQFTYLVESVLKVQEVGASLEERQKNAQYMMPTQDTRLTLITCWPEWVYTHRIIVIARPL